MPIIIKIAPVVTSQVTKKDAVLSLIEAFAEKGPDGRDLANIISAIARYHKVPVNLLLNQAIGILAGETGYFTSGQYKACNNGGMTTNAKNWIGDKVVTADTVLVSTSYIPITEQRYFDINTDGSTRIELLESWFRKTSSGEYDKYLQPGGKITYPKLKSKWMGVIVKCLYLVTEKTPANYITVRARSYGDKLYAPYAKLESGPSQKTAIYRLAANTLIYNSPGSAKGLDAYIALVESCKRNLICTII